MNKIKFMDTLILLLAMALFYGMVFVILIIFEPIILVDNSIETLISIKNAFLWSVPVLFFIFFIKDCISIAPRSNFPSEFSTSGKRHNISSKDNSNELSQISSNDETSLNNKIHSQQTKPLLEDVKGMDMHPNNMHTSSHKGLLKTADIKINKIK